MQYLLLQWLTDLRDKVTLSDGSPIPVVLLANKCDVIGATVSTDHIKTFCKECKIDGWYITSAKENINIGMYFHHNSHVIGMYYIK